MLYSQIAANLSPHQRSIAVVAKETHTWKSKEIKLLWSAHPFLDLQGSKTIAKEETERFIQTRDQVEQEQNNVF